MMMEILKEKCLFFFYRYKNWCYAGCFGFLGVLVLIIGFGAAPGVEEYIAAKKAVMQWEAEGDAEGYTEMQKKMAQVPALEEKYRSVIAQKLFQKEKLADALILAAQSLEKIKKEVPFHAAYAQATLSIEQGLFQEALEKAVRLKERMLRECSFEKTAGEQPADGAFLFAYNLLRIASLQKELHNKPGEKAAWEDLEKFFVQNQEAERLLLSNFREKEITLSDYISERKKHL